MLESFPYRRVSQIRDNLHWCLYVNCSVMKAGRSNLTNGISASVNVKSLNHLMFLLYFHWNNNGNFASLIRKRMQHSGKHIFKKSHLNHWFTVPKAKGVNEVNSHTSLPQTGEGNPQTQPHYESETCDHLNQNFLACLTPCKECFVSRDCVTSIRKIP